MLRYFVIGRRLWALPPVCECLVAYVMSLLRNTPAPHVTVRNYSGYRSTSALPPPRKSRNTMTKLTRHC